MTAHSRDSGSSGRSWLARTDWLWMIIGGFYLVAYLFWYLPALRGLPDSAADPPSRYPWHWTLDFTATGLTGAVLLRLGFGRAAELTGDDGGHGDPDEYGEPSEPAGNGDYSDGRPMGR